MAEYGLTPTGPNIKRLDVILDEMHTDLSEKWGVNTRQNPESLINHLLTNVADQLAELWEFGEDTYYSQYPSTAEGVSLDNVAQLGGSTRNEAAKSRYPIHCTGIDGTVLAAGTLIASETNPTTQLSIREERTITRAAFNRAVVKVSSVSLSSPYTVAINGTVYSFAPTEESAVEILKGIVSSMKEVGFTLAVDEQNELLYIDADDINSTNELVLSENLTTETVTTIITFSTVETGDILLPNGVITNIVKADAGLLEVVNLCTYIAGHGVETDSEFRQSYVDKIFNRSSAMLESIRAAIIDNVQGVESVAAYENPSHYYDDYGRPPHSVEIVVDGGNSDEIAQQILNNKAGGINTCGDVVVMVSGKYDEDIPIRFNRPEVVYTWFRIGITLSKTDAIPPNYAELLREVVLSNISAAQAGTDIVPQKFMSELYQACTGISYIDIGLHTTTELLSEPPENYTERSAIITARQRARTTEEMIEVEIDG